MVMEEAACESLGLCTPKAGMDALDAAGVANAGALPDVVAGLLAGEIAVAMTTVLGFGDALGDVLGDALGAEGDAPVAVAAAAAPAAAMLLLVDGVVINLPAGLEVRAFGALGGVDGAAPTRALVMELQQYFAVKMTATFVVLNTAESQATL